MTNKSLSNYNMSDHDSLSCGKGWLRVRRRNGYIALIIGCAIPVFLLAGILFRGQKDISEDENRTLTHFPALSAHAFLSGSFQSDLESALGDQYLFGAEVKHAVLSVQNGISAAEKMLLLKLSPDSGNSYAEIVPGYYHFAGDEHRIVEKPWDAGTDAERIQRAAKVFNQAENVKKYLYFIRNSRAQDFRALPEENDRVYELVKDAYRADRYGCFAAENYDDYCRLFYQTDHHWNHRGADKGYREIVKLLEVGEEPIDPDREQAFDVVFNGSYARQTKELCADEPFTVYTYPTAKLKTELNGKRGVYGHQNLYAGNRFPTDNLRNHYAYYYGGDYGEIVLDNGKSRGRNLLVLADSYSNPINMLLASHFDRTCIIDLRYYAKDMGVEFDINDYIRKHEIDSLLIMGDIALFADAQEEEAQN